MTGTIEALRGREQQQEQQARDAIAIAARTVAAGGATDLEVVEAALAAVGLSAADFEKAVALARSRAEWLSVVDRLPAAKSKLTKAEKTLQAEYERFIAARDAFAEKAAILQDEIETATAAVRAGNSARDRLLDPKNVSGGIAGEYGDAVREARLAEAAVGDAEADLTRLDRRLAAIVDTILRLCGQRPEDIDPGQWRAPEGAPEWHRDGHHGELERRLVEWRAIVRERESARERLAEATTAHAAWRNKRDGMVSEVLKT